MIDFIAQTKKEMIKNLPCFTSLLLVKRRIVLFSSVWWPWGMRLCVVHLIQVGLRMYCSGCTDGCGKPFHLEQHGWDQHIDEVRMKQVVTQAPKPQTPKEQSLLFSADRPASPRGCLQYCTLLELREQWQCAGWDRPEWKAIAGMERRKKID